MDLSLIRLFHRYSSSRHRRPRAAHSAPAKRSLHRSSRQLRVWPHIQASVAAYDCYTNRRRRNAGKDGLLLVRVHIILCRLRQWRFSTLPKTAFSMCCISTLSTPIQPGASSACPSRRTMTTRLSCEHKSIHRPVHIVITAKIVKWVRMNPLLDLCMLICTFRYRHSNAWCIVALQSGRFRRQLAQRCAYALVAGLSTNTQNTANCNCFRWAAAHCHCHSPCSVSVARRILSKSWRRVHLCHMVAVRTFGSRSYQTAERTLFHPATMIAPGNYVFT